MAPPKGAMLGGKMELASRDLYGKGIEAMMPLLLKELRTPAAIAGRLGVYPEAVRQWLKRHGGHYDRKKGVWVYNGSQSTT